MGARTSQTSCSAVREPRRTGSALLSSGLETCCCLEGRKSVWVLAGSQTWTSLPSCYGSVGERLREGAERKRHGRWWGAPWRGIEVLSLTRWGGIVLISLQNSDFDRTLFWELWMEVWASNEFESEIQNSVEIQTRNFQQLTNSNNVYA